MNNGYIPWQENLVGRFRKKGLPLQPDVIELLYSLNPAGARYDVTNGRTPPSGYIVMRNPDGVRVRLETIPSGGAHSLMVTEITHPSIGCIYLRGEHKDVRYYKVREELNRLFPQTSPKANRKK